jgi:hypothetical protein
MRRLQRTKKLIDQPIPPHANNLNPQEMDGVGIAPAAIARLALEVWRLGRRVEAAPGTSGRIADSYTRLVRELEALGVRIDDPFRRRFVDGTHAEIVDLPDGADPARETLIVSDVLRPAVFVDGQCVVVPQIILQRAEPEGGSSATQ